MTETTQPDPQVVAWMRAWRRQNDDGSAFTPARACRAWLDVEGHESLLDSPYSLRELVAAFHASQHPLTVADIPAGQGPASLYIGPGHRGELAVMYRTGLDRDHVFMTEGPDDPTEARRAMWDHLAATLPHVTTEEDR